MERTFTFLGNAGLPKATFSAWQKLAGVLSACGQLHRRHQLLLNPVTHALKTDKRPAVHQVMFPKIAQLCYTCNVTIETVHTLAECAYRCHITGKFRSFCLHDNKANKVTGCMCMFQLTLIVAALDTNILHIIDQTKSNGKLTLHMLGFVLGSCPAWLQLAAFSSSDSQH